MEYLHFKQVKGLVEQIENHQRNLDAISGNGAITIHINQNGDYGGVFSIGVWDSSEHEYAKMGRDFVDLIKSDLQRRIDDLKSILRTL